MCGRDAGRMPALPRWVDRPRTRRTVCNRQRPLTDDGAVKKCIFVHHMAKTKESEDSRTSIGAILTEPNGALLVDVVITDGESFHSFLTPQRDIADQVTNDTSEEAVYSGSFWLVDMDRGSSGALFACDADGNVHTNVSGRWGIEPLSPGHGLRVVRCLPDGSVFAAGTDGIVYRRDREGWVAVSDSFGRWITGLDGRSAADLVIAGDAGLVAQFDGTSWSSVDLATDLTFNAVLASDGRYVVCGAKGALFEGSGATWQNRTASTHDLHGLAHYRGEVWLACGSSGAGRLTSDGVEIMRSTFAAFSLSAAGDIIAFGGNNIAARFNGTSWHGRRFG